jgi:hypothetical protein
MIAAIIITMVLVVVTFTLHYYTLLALSNYIPQSRTKRDLNVLIIVGVLFVSHIVEISLYALGYYLSISILELGTLHGAVMDASMAYFYYSGIIFTTLGLGDIYPVGHIQVMTMIESLNGFLLITWSASYTFLAMSRFWKWNDGCL